MKIVSYKGGLGNQMFQYAFHKRLEMEYPSEKILAETFSFDNYKLHQGFEIETRFNISLERCTKQQFNALSSLSRTRIGRVKRKLFGTKGSEIIESEAQKFSYDENLFKKKGDNYFSGYWQSFLYIDPVRDQLLKSFTLVAPLSSKNMDILQAINLSNSVSIHIRRGDYINHPNFGGICDLDYYENTLQIIEEKIENPQFFVFSDDIEWCKSNLPRKEWTFIDWNTGNDSYLDMILMSRCKGNIIANSSFSWWAAYLNQQEDKVIIAPSKWKNNMDGTRDLLPESWITVSID